MCGIAGVVDFGGRVAAAVVERMCVALRHRGPDDQGIVRFPRSPAATVGRAGAVLGSRRLSIIDLHMGHQPIGNEDGSIWTTLNGEIYNFTELRVELEGKGHRFASRSDTEVIVHLYEERGPDFVAALDGMFALALWDDEHQRLVLARDRLGKKPLLYADMGERLSFASEFRALLLDPSVPRDLDVGALGEYLTYMAIPAPLTIYRAIRKLPPGHMLIRDRHGTAVRAYWRLRYAPKLELGEAEAAARVRDLLTTAVRKRLVSDVPLGAFLSGGVDSSSVVALMARLSASPVKTFSIGFEEPRYDELPHARRVARACGTEHHEFVVRPSAIDVLPALVRHFGEPFADSSAIPTFYLAKLTRQHVTVALNGDGGDEVFAGYGRHLANRLAEAWQRSPAVIRQPLGWAIRATGAGRACPGRTPSRLGRFLEAAALSRAMRYRRWVGVLTPDLAGALSRNGTDAPGGDGIVEKLFAEHEALDAVDASLAVDTAFYLPTDLLVKMDITSMAHSLEARSPFLDTDLVEFAARLPSRFKLRGVTTKYILKRAMAGIVPRENLHREKRGFAVPMAQWFRSELRGFLVDHLLSDRFDQRGLFRKREVERLVRGHLEGHADHAHQLWVLLVLEVWHRTAVDGAWAVPC